MILFPDNALPAGVQISAYAGTLQSRDAALTRSTRSVDNHRWLLSVEYPAQMYREYWGRAFGFYAGQRGRYRTFDFVPPGFERRGASTGTPLIAGGGQTGRLVDTDGWGANETGILKEGDYIRIEEKVYVITSDAGSDGAGFATLDIEPGLISSPLDNTPLIIDDVPFRVALLSDEIESNYDYNEAFTLTVDLTEAI